MKYALAILLSLVAVQASASFLPAIAVAIAEVETAKPTPPAPSPDNPSETCDNCNGTGKVGDGTVFVDCPVCGGDGIKSEYQIASITGGTAESSAAEAPPAIASLPADQQPTPMPVIAAAINALKPQVGDVFIDFGCGPDARACIVAARDCGLDAIGVEIDPAVADEARRVVAANGLSHKIRIITADATKIDVPEATIGFAYLWPDTLAALHQKIERLRAFASYAHDVPGLSMDALTVNGDTVYVWRQRRFATIPAQYRTETYQQKICGPGGCRYVTRTRQVLVSPARTVEVGASSPPAQPAAYIPPPAVYAPQPVMYRRPVAYWGGRAYTSAKPGCNCAMCRSLRAQLSGW